MKFGLLNDRPDHPMLAEVAAMLGRDHEVVVLNETAGSAAQIAAREALTPAQVYLCKSHSPHALDLAARLEASGAVVINGAEATSNAQDRVWMAAQLARAGIPAPQTTTLRRLGDLLTLDGPVVVKSRMSRRGDLVTHVDGGTKLGSLMADWADEPVIVQAWVPNSGWDLKLWCVGRTLFAAHRQTPLEMGDSSVPRPAATLMVNPAEVPTAVRKMAEAVAVVFRLEIFGVDIIGGPDGAVVVDVNSFPGARGIPGVADSIVALARARARKPVESLT
jgi:ribosomal protein S6--L-glutamate ligase